MAKNSNLQKKRFPLLIQGKPLFCRDERAGIRTPDNLIKSQVLFVDFIGFFGRICDKTVTHFFKWHKKNGSPAVRN